MPVERAVCHHCGNVIESRGLGHKLSCPRPWGKEVLNVTEHLTEDDNPALLTRGGWTQVRRTDHG